MPAFRSFVAISLPTEAKSVINQAIRHWGILSDQVRWVPAHQYHFTLAFLGEVDQERLPEIAEATAAYVADLPPFTIEIGGFGAFPSLHKARVLWLGVAEGADYLHQVYRRVWSALLPFGFTDDGTFHPHLTLGRVKTSIGHLTLTEPPTELNSARVKFAVNELVLLKSELSANGPKYTELSVMPLLGQ